MDNIGKTLFSLVLIALMLFKVSAFHVYDHHEEDADHQECHLCDQAIDNQLAEFNLHCEISLAPEVSKQIDVVKTIGSTVSFVSLKYRPYFFSRPPPQKA